MKNILLLFSRKAQLRYENRLGEESGIMLMDSPRVNRENVPLMLLLKAALVFCVLMGSIDCYMSGFKIEYDYMLIFTTTAVISAVFALTNTNIVLTALIYSLCAYYISVIVNTQFDLIVSGVIALVNMSYKLIREKYKFPSVDGFEEMIPDRTVTVPAVIILGAVIMGMLIAFFICRFMNVMLIALITCLPMGIVLFFEGTPSVSSCLMLGTSWILTAVIKFAHKFGHVRMKRYMNAYYIRDKIYYKQMCDGTAVLQCIVILVVIGAIAAGIAASVFGSAAFDTLVKPSKTKEKLDFAVRDTMIITFSNYKNYKITSYTSSGQLGFYGNISPDFEPDLRLTVLPYTTDRIYFRSFIGSDYKYRGNMWNNKTEENAFTDKEQASATARAAREKGVFAKISLYNEGIAGQNGYVPYYTDLSQTESLSYVQDDIITGSLGLGERVNISYYPLLDEENLNGEISGDYKGYVYKNYTEVPEELRLKLASLCSGEGFRKDDGELEQKIKDYFQNNFEYNLKSGRLPWNTDFAEYFLFESKSGVCAHFATAATLIYRSLGIPARYVEGYCADYPVIMQGEKREDLDPREWLGGAKPLSNYVMEAELSDYNAHAWVEIYKEGIGWVVTDPTPYVSEEVLKEESEEKDLLEELTLYFQDAGERNKNDKLFGGFEGLIGFLAAFLRLIARAAVAAVIYLLLLRPFVWKTVRYAAGKKGSKARAVEMQLSYLMSLAGFCHKNQGERLNVYRELCRFIAELGMDKAKTEEMLRLGEKSLYSRNGIDEGEYKKALVLINEAKRVILRSAPLYLSCASVVARVK